MTKILLAKIVAYTIATIAAVSSYGHQVALLALADLDPLFGIIPSEWVTPLTVDALAIVALMVRTSDQVTAATKRWALVPLVLAGGMSVAANVATAHNPIQVVVGVWTVGAYIVAELFVAKMERKAHNPPHAPAPAAAPVSPGSPAAPLDSPEEVAFRSAQRELRSVSRLAALNAVE